MFRMYNISSNTKIVFFLLPEILVGFDILKKAIWNTEKIRNTTVAMFCKQRIGAY